MKPLTAHEYAAWSANARAVLAKHKIYQRTLASELGVNYTSLSSVLAGSCPFTLIHIRDKIDKFIKDLGADNLKMAQA